MVFLSSDHQKSHKTQASINHHDTIICTINGTILYKLFCLSFIFTILTFIFVISGNAHAVMDLTLINPDPIVTNSEASLLCVNSEWSIPDVPNIGRDLALPNQQMSQHASHDDSHRFALKVTWQERSSDIFGAFYCGERSKDSSNKVYTVKMLDEGKTSFSIFLSYNTRNCIRKW